MRSVTAYVKVCLLFEKPVDFFAVLLYFVLDVDLLGAVSREGGVDFEIVTEGLFVLLQSFVSCLRGVVAGSQLTSHSFAYIKSSDCFLQPKNRIVFPTF
jgi:hypothetical protein